MYPFICFSMIMYTFYFNFAKIILHVLFYNCFSHNNISCTSFQLIHTDRSQCFPIISYNSALSVGSKAPQGERFLFALIFPVFLEFRRITDSKTFGEGTNESTFMPPFIYWRVCWLFLSESCHSFVYFIGPFQRTNPWLCWRICWSLSASIFFMSCFYFLWIYSNILYISS